MTADGIYRNALGHEYLDSKPGRKKKLTAAQSALVFELQVQVRAAERLIERTLDAAGVSTDTRNRSRIRGHIWRDRGRIDVMRKSGE
jgi:hypothetical protein